MILRRSSSRCSRNPMAGICSLSPPCEGSSAATSGIGRLGGGIGPLGQLRGGMLLGCMLLGVRVEHGPAGHRAPWRIHGRKVLGRAGFAVKVGDLGLDLRLEFVGGPLELVQSLANLPADLRQFLRPKQNESPEKNENHLWKTEIHAAIILRELDWQQRGGVFAIFLCKGIAGLNPARRRSSRRARGNRPERIYFAGSNR